MYTSFSVVPIEVGAGHVLLDGDVLMEAPGREALNSAGSSRLPGLSLCIILPVRNEDRRVP